MHSHLLKWPAHFPQNFNLFPVSEASPRIYVPLDPFASSEPTSEFDVTNVTFRQRSPLNSFSFGLKGDVPAKHFWHPAGTRPYSACNKPFLPTFFPFFHSLLAGYSCSSQFAKTLRQCFTYFCLYPRMLTEELVSFAGDVTRIKKRRNERKNPKTSAAKRVSGRRNGQQTGQLHRKKTSGEWAHKS